jgi:hypothetical protein
MTTSLILQIQEAALDSKSSVTDALRKAKIACVKLGLTEFGNWVDLELTGYIGKKLRYYGATATRNEPGTRLNSGHDEQPRRFRPSPQAR